MKYQITLTNQPQMTVATPPPMKPSHVFFGDSYQKNKSFSDTKVQIKCWKLVEEPYQ